MPLSVEKELEFYLEHHQNCFALRVSGFAMQPTIPAGSMLYVNPNRKPNLKGKDIAVIRIASKLIVCRLYNLGANQLLMKFDDENEPQRVLYGEKTVIVGTAFAAKHDDGWELLDDDLQNKIKDHQTAATVAV